MVSHPELGSDQPIGSDRESGCDTPGFKGFLSRPLGPCSGFKAKRRGFSVLFSFSFSLSFSFGRHIGLLFMGSLTY